MAVINLPTNCLSGFDHFVILALKGLILIRFLMFLTYLLAMDNLCIYFTFIFYLSVL